MSWLHEACGGIVRIVGDGLSAASPDGTLSHGILLCEVSASAGLKWFVRLEEHGEPVAVHHAALRRTTPSHGHLAKVVLGESKGLKGRILSIEGGVAVLDTTDQSAERSVRVLPLDALCQLDERVVN